MSSRRYYWIKLREDFFNSPEIDWLQEQEKGCDYIYLFEKLCMLTANNNGELSRKVGEMIIAYDVKKLAALTRFDFDTVAVALELYKKIGLVYQNKNGILVIANIKEMVGSETDWAVKKRKQRLDNVQKMSQKCLSDNAGHCPKICPTDIDIDIDIDTKDISKDISCPEKPNSPPLKTKKAQNLKAKVKTIIDYLNAKLNTRYKADNKKTLELVNARLKEGFTIDDFKNVIDKKTIEWVNDPSMYKYLRPVTLFSTKFESYLNQPTKKPSNKRVNKFQNFEPRKYDFEEIERLAQQD